MRSDRKSESRAAPRKKIATLSNSSRAAVNMQITFLVDPGRSPFHTPVNFGAVEA